MMKYRISKNEMYFKNTNLTQGTFNNTVYPSTYTTTVFNLTSPSIYNGTLTSGTIITNTQANLTLAPSQSIYISDSSWT